MCNQVINLSGTEPSIFWKNEKNYAMAPFIAKLYSPVH